MKTNLKNNSIVIIAISHNPSIISDFFLIKSNMIQSVEELEKNNVIITPAFSQVVFKDGTNIQLDNSRLNISSNNIEKATTLAVKYCNSLPFIKCNAIGLNFEFNLSEFDFDKWFYHKQAANYKNTLVKGIDLTFRVSNKINATVKVVKESNTSAAISFNFHSEFSDIPLSEIDYDFNAEKIKLLEISKEFIELVFK